MTVLLAILSGVLMAVGFFFMAVAAIGFTRLPDIFCRLHVTGILDTFGAPMILLGAAVWVFPSLTSGKLVLALCFLFVTSPLVGHLLSLAAMEAGYKARSVEERESLPHGLLKARAPGQEAEPSPELPGGEGR